MPFVKLDVGMLDSTLWVDRAGRDLFITALLLAEPFEIEEPVEQLEVRSIAATGFTVPPGWYGFVPAAGVGIIRRALLPEEEGLAALERLGAPDPQSRSSAFEGRRLVRVDGGYLVLNFMRFRERDYTGAERQRRYRKLRASRRNGRDVTRDVTHAENRRQRTEGKVQKAPAPGSSLRSDPSAGKPSVAPVALPEWIDPEKFKAWIAIRPSKARTPAAQAAAIEKLERLRSQGHDANAIIAESLSNGWQGIFPPKNGNGQVAPPLSLAERNRAAVEEAKRRHHEEQRELEAFAAELRIARSPDETQERFLERVRAERHARGRAHAAELRAKFGTTA